MAAGDTLRRIGPNDQLIINAAGQVVGIKNPNASGADLYFDPNAIALAAGSIGVGVRVGPSLNDYGQSNPIYIAHRGSAALYPEESKVAYDNALNDGEAVLECDVQTLSGGTLGVIHDSTVDRTTTGTGNVNTFTSATFQALTMDSSVWLGSNYGDTLNPMMFQAFIDAYKNKAILSPEDKDVVSMTAMVRALVNSGVRRDQVLVQSFDPAGLTTALAYGFQALGLGGGGTPTAATIVSKGAQWAGISWPDDISSYVAAGLKTVYWTVNRRYIRDQGLARGASGFFSDDPTYLRSNVALRKSDAFAMQTWVPGMLTSDSDAGITTANRGTFTAPDWWGFASATVPTANYYSVLLGYLCPVASPNSFALQFNAVYDAANGGDTTRWFSVYIGTSDAPYTNASDGLTGYHLLFRLNGSLEIYRKDAGQATVQLAAQTGAALSTGTEYTFRVQVTPSGITLSRTSGTSPNSVSATDTAYRGGYLHFGRTGMACRFRAVTVS